MGRGFIYTLYPHGLRQRREVGRIEIVRNLTLQHFGSQICLMFEAASMQILFICCLFFPLQRRPAGFSVRIPLLRLLVPAHGIEFSFTNLYSLDALRGSQVSTKTNK
jgi:hypothetical protein